MRAVLVTAVNHPARGDLPHDVVVIELLKQRIGITTSSADLTLLGSGTRPRPRRSMRRAVVSLRLPDNVIDRDSSGCRVTSARHSPLEIGRHARAMRT